MARINISIAGPSDYLSVVDFVNTNFVPREPTCEALGLCPDEGYRMPFFDSWCMARIQREGSLVVVAETGEKELVGVGFACHMKPGEEEVEDEPVTEKTQRTHRVPVKFQRIMDFLGWFEEKGIAKDLSSLPPNENGRLDYTIITGRAEGPRIPGRQTKLFTEEQPMIQIHSMKYAPPPAFQDIITFMYPIHRVYFLYVWVYIQIGQN